MQSTEAEARNHQVMISFEVYVRVVWHIQKTAPKSTPDYDVIDLI